MLFAITEITSFSDRDYLDQLYRDTFPMLKKLAVSIIYDEFAAGDIVANAMLGLFSKIGELRNMPEAKRIGYLRKAVRNAAYKQYARTQKNLTDSVPFESLLFSLPSSASADPAVLTLEYEEYRLVRDVISTLPETERRIIFLKYSAGLSAKEIASLTGVPSENAINVRLSRARQKVVRQLLERGWGYE